MDSEHIWDVTVDQGRFHCHVTQDATNVYKGTLIVTCNDTSEELLNEEVVITYGAPFGPDIADVRIWEMSSIGIIDRWLEEHGEPAPEPTEEEENAERT